MFDWIDFYIYQHSSSGRVREGAGVDANVGRPAQELYDLIRGLLLR